MDPHTDQDAIEAVAEALKGRCCSFGDGDGSGGLGWADAEYCRVASEIIEEAGLVSKSMYKEYCGNWKEDDRCGAPAEFIVWGKLFPSEALGPRCYDCAAEQVGHHGLYPGNPQSYAIFHLPKP